MSDYEPNLRALREKVRSLFAEHLDDSTKELLFENLVEQAYYTGQTDAAQSALEQMLTKARKPL